jgi:hypothetical protein
LWVRVFQPIAISAALALGIIIGAYFGRNGQDKLESPISRSEQVEILRAELYISDVTDEDKILNLKH